MKSGTVVFVLILILIFFGMLALDKLEAWGVIPPSQPQVSQPAFSQPVVQLAAQPAVSKGDVEPSGTFIPDSSSTSGNLGPVEPDTSSQWFILIGLTGVGLLLLMTMIAFAFLQIMINWQTPPEGGRDVNVTLNQRKYQAYLQWQRAQERNRSTGK
jgi:hypothetical protein